jgi:hypothetical protein
MPARTRRMGAPFNFESCSDNSLEELIVEGVFATGENAHTLVVLGLVNRTFNQIVRRIVDTFIATITALFNTYETNTLAYHSLCSLSRGVADECENRCVARRAMNDALEKMKRTACAFFGEDRGSQFVAWADSVVRDGVWCNYFKISRTFVASIATRSCMACAGVGRRCAMPRYGGTFMIYCGVPLYTKRKCLDAISVYVQCFSTDPLERFKKSLTNLEDSVTQKNMMAATMLRMAGIFNSQSGRNALLARVNGVTSSRMVLENHPHIPSRATLQGRLGLSNKAVLHARAEVEHARASHAREAAVLSTVRKKRHFHEIDMVLSRELNRPNALRQLLDTFDQLGDTLDTILYFDDPFSVTQRSKSSRKVEIVNQYVNALDIDTVSALVRQITYIIGTVWRIDLDFERNQRIRGRAASGDAHQWGMGLHGSFYSLVDDRDIRPTFFELQLAHSISHSSKRKMSCIVDVDKFPTWTSVKHAFVVLALRCYDAMRPEDVEMTSCESKCACRSAHRGPHMHWRVLVARRASRPRFSIAGTLTIPTHADAKIVHEMITKAFGHFEVPIPDALVKLPTKSKFDSSVAAVDEYYTGVGRALMSSPRTMNLVAPVLNMTTINFVDGLVAEYGDWRKARFDASPLELFLAEFFPETPR